MLIDKNFHIVDSTIQLIESNIFVMQLCRLYLFICLCKGFLMMNKFKILLVIVVMHQ